MSKFDYDLCVVGAGLIGSAAARHASQLSPGSVCLIGPSEPKERNINDHRDIYGAHYDEGRITRSLDSDPVWATLAQRSILRYRDIEKMSGIPFYTEVGNMAVGDEKQEMITRVKRTAQEQNVPCKILSTGELRNRFPYLNFSENDIAVYEKTNAGHISPRKMVEAQKLIASKHGCAYFDDVVNNVTRIVQPGGTYGMEVKTDQGMVFLCKKVLLATGSFTTFRNLLPGLEPVQNLCALTVSLVEVSTQDAEKMRQMPCVIYSGKGKEEYHKNFPRNPDGTVSYYMLPPVRYPDGRYYIKLGHWHATVPARLYTPKEVKDWYCSGNPKLAEDTANFIKTLFKGITMERYKGDFCVVTETKTDRPYIDKVHAQLGVAIGGNGYAAKSSDEIGRIAATMMLSGWDSQIPEENFRLILRKTLTHANL